MRQVAELCAGALDGLADATDLVRAEIVHDDDIVQPQNGDEHLADIGEEAAAVDRTLEDASATSSSSRKTPMEVEVSHCPCGTAALRR